MFASLSRLAADALAPVRFDGHPAKAGVEPLYRPPRALLLGLVDGRTQPLDLGARLVALAASLGEIALESDEAV
jgi:hypothetical protein